MMKRGLSVLLSSAGAFALTAAFSGTANAGAGDCCDQLEDLQRRILLLEEKAAQGGLEPKWKAAPQWSQDGWQFKVRGRVMADYSIQDIDLGTTEASDQGAEFRRVRLGAEGKIMSKTKYKFEVDFAENEVDITDAYVQQKWGPAKITLGQFRTPNSLEENTSSKYITFIERAFITDAFQLGRQIGVGADFGGDQWTFKLGAFSGPAGGGDGSTTAGIVEQEQYALAARGTFAPIANDDMNVHLGAHIRYRGFEDAGGDGVRYRQRAAAHHRTGFRPIGNFRVDADSDLTYGFEAAGTFGPFSLQGEYMRLEVECNDTSDVFGDIACPNDDPSFWGWYVDASVFLTGESRNYQAKKGKFGRVKVANPVNDGGLGAWQLAVRYDYVDLTDDDVAGLTQTGEMTGIIGGINWHLNNYTRMMLNYGYSDVDDNTANLGDGEVQNITFRAQVDW